MNKRLLSTAWTAGLCVMTLSPLCLAQAEGQDIPRTSWGDPKIQGYWTNSTFVPLQRPEELGRQEFYTQEEMIEIVRSKIESNYDENLTGTQADVHYQFDDYGMNRTEDSITRNLRTSIIFDPPDGRYPELTAAARAEQAEYNAFRRDHQWDSAKTRSLSERCLIWDQEGPPILPLGYNSTYQFMQTEDYVILQLEMIHDVRIIPLDGGDPAENALPQWLGNSRGHWEGDTLVVETTGFSGRTNAPGLRGAPMSTDARVVERFTPIDEHTIDYEFTVTDPTVWERPWSGNYPFSSIDGPMFEYACHEGNYGIVNILSGVRMEELEALKAEAGNE